MYKYLKLITIIIIIIIIIIITIITRGLQMDEIRRLDLSKYNEDSEEGLIQEVSLWCLTTSATI